jgi:hypothetical protein
MHLSVIIDQWGSHVGELWKWSRQCCCLCDLFTKIKNSLCHTPPQPHFSCLPGQSTISILGGLCQTQCVSAHSALPRAYDFLSALSNVLSLCTIIWLNVMLENMCTWEHVHRTYVTVAWVIVWAYSCVSVFVPRSTHALHVAWAAT